MSSTTTDKFKQFEHVLHKAYPFLTEESDWTDFTFNGSQYYMNRRDFRRERVDVPILDVEQFIRQLANLTGKNFNHSSPLIDLSFGKYRMNAAFSSIVRVNSEPSFSFSIRKMSSELCADLSNTLYMPKDIYIYLQNAVKNKQSILISGRTGTGKTELQKRLLMMLQNHTRIVIIEDTYETHIKELGEHLDVTTWVAPASSHHLLSTYRELLMSALRNNPDWIVISELRGEEGQAVYEAALAGHPLITTLHTSDPQYNIPRIRHLITQHSPMSDHQIDEYLVQLFPCSVHMADYVNGQGIREYYVEQLVEHSYDRRSHRHVTRPLYIHPHHVGGKTLP
jgi:pilus assembly protein CpaF